MTNYKIVTIVRLAITPHIEQIYNSILLEMNYGN
jgi:hypothetical protein